VTRLPRTIAANALAESTSSKATRSNADSFIQFSELGFGDEDEVLVLFTWWPARHTFACGKASATNATR